MKITLILMEEFRFYFKKIILIIYFLINRKYKLEINELNKLANTRLHDYDKKIEESQKLLVNFYHLD